MFWIHAALLCELEQSIGVSYNGFEVGNWGHTMVFDLSKRIWYCEAWTNLNATCDHKHFQMHFPEGNDRYFSLNFIEMCSLRFSWYLGIVGINIGLAPNKQQDNVYNWQWRPLRHYCGTGSHFTNSFILQYQIKWIHIPVFYWPSDSYKILHMAWQHSCHAMCKIL